MTTYSYAQLEGIWLQAAAGTKYATQTWAALMAAVAEAESGGNPAALNPNDNGGQQSSFGLWQISTGSHAAPDPNWNNPLINAQLAIGKLDSQGLGAWGTYTSGAYKAFLNSTTSPDTSVVAGADTSAAAAGSTSAADAAQANCAWSIGWGGIPGTSWLSDLFGGGGNIGGGEVCLLSKPQLRGIAGVGVLLLGGFVFLIGTTIFLGSVGLPFAAGAVLPGGVAAKVAGAAGGAEAATTVKPPPKRPGTGPGAARRRSGRKPPQQEPRPNVEPVPTESQTASGATPRRGGRTQQGQPANA